MQIDKCARAGRRARPHTHTHGKILSIQNQYAILNQYATLYSLLMGTQYWQAQRAVVVFEPSCYSRQYKCI
jgi:hypothetical protein